MVTSLVWPVECLKKVSWTNNDHTVECLSDGNTFSAPPNGYIILKPDKELPHRLHRAVWKRRKEKVTMLLNETSGRNGEPKYDVNAVDKQGRFIYILLESYFNIL